MLLATVVVVVLVLVVVVVVVVAVARCRRHCRHVSSSVVLLLLSNFVVDRARNNCGR